MNKPNHMQSLHRYVLSSVSMQINPPSQTRRFGQWGFSRAPVLLLLLALAVLALPVRAATSLITNGNFETSTAVGSVTLPPGTAALAGWSIVAKVYITATGTTFWPGNSTRWISLVDLQGNGSMEQSFATTLGKTYQASMRTFNGGLVFSAAPGPTSTAFTVSATGNPAVTVMNTPGQEKTVTYQFTAVGATSTLLIADASGYASNAGWIDDVVVEEVNINKTAASVTLGSLSQSYDGSPKPATATTVPVGLMVIITYNESTTVPTAAGSYAVVATVIDDTYAGSASGTLNISQALPSTISFAAPLPITGIGAIASFADTRHIGRTDILTVNPSNASVSVGYKNADLTFAVGGVFGYGQNGAAFIDVDGDGWDDMVLVGLDTGVSVFHNNHPNDQHTGFTLLQNLPNSYLSTGYRAYGLAWGDVDGDGDIDLMVGSTAQVFYVLVNDGTGLFTKGWTSAFVPGGASSIMLRDLNGDGRPDFVAVGSCRGANVWVNNADGTGTFTPKYAINGTNLSPSSGRTQSALQIADLNGDLRPDLVVTEGDRIAWYENTGDMNNFTPRVVHIGVGQVPAHSPTTTAGFYTLAAADLDGDGDVDVVATPALDPLLWGGVPEAFVNNGQGIFTKAWTASLTYLASTAPTSASVIVLNDIDRNGKLNLLGWGRYGASQFGENLTASAATPPVITSADSASGIFGVSFSYQITATSSPTSYSATGLPAGLLVNTSSGLISGTVANSGTYTFTVSATNAGGTGTRTVTLTIAKATPVITWSAPPAITYGTALGVAQLNATANAPGTFVYTPASGTVLNAGANQSLSVAFTPTDLANYDTGAATVSIPVQAAVLTVTAANASRTYGSNNPDFTGTIVGVVNSDNITATYSTPATAVSNVGTYPITPALVDPSGKLSNYSVTPNNGGLTIAKATPVITWSAPPSITYGDALSAAQLNATANVLGAFTYSPAAGTVLNAGAQTLTGMFTPADTANYNGTSATVTLNVLKATATVTLGSLSQTYNRTPKPATATTSPANLTVTFIYNGATLPPTAVGSYFVVGRVVDSNYTGLASGTLFIRNPPGTVFAWGRNNFGQTTVPPDLTGVTAVAGGLYHSLALKSDMTVVAWGNNSEGQTTVPAGLSDVTAVAAGFFHSVALASDGKVFTWGYNFRNQMNVDEMSVPAGLSDVTAISAGGYHTVALKSDNTVVAWGDNTYGATSVPPDLSGVTAIAAGGTHTAALKSDGTVVAWGDNAEGQRTVPAGLTDVTAIAAGVYHTVALKLDGTVVVWGNNTYGQRNVPSGLTGVTAIAAGGHHTLALKLDGIVVAWGDNSDGQSTVPAGLTGVSAIAAGGIHSLATSATTAKVTLRSLAHTYDGNPKLVTATTVPAGLNVDFTYNGSTSAPTAAGSYAVVATVNDASYTGSAKGTLVIASLKLTNLKHTYDGKAKTASATTEPAALKVNFTYDGSSTPPTNAGSYTVVGRFDDPNYAGSTSGTLVIAPAAATVTLGSLLQLYDGNPKSASATTTPAGLGVSFTYNTSSTPPTNVDNSGYTVVGTITDPNYTGSTSGTLSIWPAEASITLGSLAHTYDGNPKPATATTVPANLTVRFIYGGASEEINTQSVSAPVPSKAGSYQVIAMVDGGNYLGWVQGTLVIATAPATVTLGSLVQPYDGKAKSASATTVPADLSVSFTYTYKGSATTPLDAGSYTVVGTITNPNYAGSATGTLTIAKAPASVTLGSLAHIYDSKDKSASAITDPPGLKVNFTYGGYANRPTNVGSYEVVGMINDPNYAGSSTPGTLVIEPAPATVTLLASSLAHIYDGTAKSASAITVPPGLSVRFTYNLSTKSPTSVGSYEVVGWITNPNYTGPDASGKLTIAKAAATVTLGSLAQTFDGTPKYATATTTPPGLTVNYTYNNSPTAPSAVGSYAVVGTVAEANYELRSASGTLTIATSGGVVAAWGYNFSGQTTVPTGLSGVTAIAAGVTHTVALKSDGKVVAWGNNTGLLGEYSGQTDVPAGLTGVAAIAAGWFHTVALKSDGNVVVWGGNGYALGTVPVGLTGVTAIAAGAAHTVALKSDGNVVAWGHNETGQTTVPARLTEVTAIAAGYLHTVALKSDRTVVAWGDNTSGQAKVPAGLTEVTAIAAGYDHTVALKSDGTVFAWGDNKDGQTTVPARLTGVTAIAAGGRYSVALKSDGTVVAWGNNTYGATDVPAGLTGVTAIAAGSHTVALVSPPILNPIIPSERVGGTVGFVLNLQGSDFKRLSVVRWNNTTLTTTLVSGSALTALVPASLAPVPANGIMTAQITVVNPGGIASAPQPFTIKASNVGPVQSKVAAAGQSVVAQTLPTAPNQAGLSASFVNKSGGPATVTTAAYTSNPKADTRIDTGGGIVDLQISGADASDSATVQFYYSSAITGTKEAALVLRYSNGATWANMKSSGGATPVKNMVNDLEGTKSGGRFTVLFDNTSRPKITELSGTVIAMSINEAPVAQPDTATVAAGAVLEIGAPGVLGNDMDLEDDPLDAVLVSEASHGQVTLQPDGSFVYTPQANYTGPDSFSYLAHDGNADSEIVTVAITVTPANAPPVIPNRTATYGAPFSFTIPPNAFGNAGTGSTVIYSAAGLPPGIALNAATRTLSGTPRAAGVFLAQVAASDNAALPPWSATASFLFTVARVPLAATANNGARDYGQPNPPLSGSLVGLVNNDKILALYNSSATESSPVGTYPIIPSFFDLEAKLGNYIVTGNNGTLTVRNVPPLVDAGRDQEKVALDEVTFIGSFNDPSSPNHVMGWDFGDGSPAVIGTLTPTHTYAKHGVYTVTLTVTDSHLASASDTLKVTVISSFGCATEARDGLMPFVKESKRIEKAVKDLTASLEPKLWLDEVHLNPKGGQKALVYWRQAMDMMEQLLKPSQKRERDDDEEDDDEEFKKLIGDKKSDNLSAAAVQAIRQALADVICASRLISETVYLESEGLAALDPKRQKQVDAELARATEDLDEANALAEQGDFEKAVRRYISSWNNTQEAIEIAGRSQPAKELVKAMELIEESLDPKYWADEPLFLHLDLKTGRKTFDLMQSAARELANVVQDAAKGRVLAAVGQQAADELADLLEKARLVSRTLFAENANLKAVNPKNQKAVDADLKRAKEDLDKGAAAETAKDFDKALSDYANAWDDTVRAIEEAAKK